MSEILPPSPGTKGALAWELFDELGLMVTVKEAIKHARERDLNENNIRTELCRWRKFNGVKI